MLALRRSREALFRWLGLGSLLVILGIFFFLLGAVLVRGYTSFSTTEIHLDLDFEEPVTRENLKNHLRQDRLNAYFAAALAQELPFLKNIFDQLDATQLLSWGGRENMEEAIIAAIEKTDAPVSHISLWVLASDAADGFYKDKLGLLSYDTRRLSSIQARVLKALEKKGKLRLIFNSRFLGGNDSTMPELAGIWGAFIGSVFTLLISLALAFPLGVGTALYLEELAPRKWWLGWVDLKLSNLASIPSVIFGLLSFILFDTLLGLPRPSTLLGGLTIGLMMAPLLMVTTRIALQSVPNSVRIAARALGASHAQVMLHHVLPIALPQIVTGTLLTMARALGETAPVLMVGMVAFVGNTPHKVTDAATTLPAQIFSWAKSAEWGFLMKTSGGILGLFFLLCVLNGVAFWLRRKFQRDA